MMPLHKDNCQPHDDGFRLDSASMNRGISLVEQERILPTTASLNWRGVAAGIAVLVGIGLAVSTQSKAQPCVTWTCQLEAMSNEEMQLMLDVMEEENSQEQDVWGQNNWDF